MLVNGTPMFSEEIILSSRAYFSGDLNRYGLVTQYIVSEKIYFLSGINASLLKHKTTAIQRSYNECLCAVNEAMSYRKIGCSIVTIHICL